MEKKMQLRCLGGVGIVDVRSTWCILTAIKSQVQYPKQNCRYSLTSLVARLTGQL